MSAVALDRVQRALPLERHVSLQIDGKLLLLAALVISVGVIMSASASVGLVGADGDHFHYFRRHLLYLSAGLAGVWLVLVRVPLRTWYVLAPFLLGATLLLLAAVLIPGIGVRVNGAQRWISLGVLNLQVSEVAKLAFILFLAGYLVRRGDELRSHWYGFFKPTLILGIVAVLIMLEPDFGSVVVLVGITFGMLFMAGIPMVVLVVLAAAGALLLGLFVWIEPYRVQRVLTYLDPWSDQFNSGYQLTQSLMAFGRGELFGVGLGNSVQKLSYLPEAHTDFVFSILAEETGLVGSVGLLALLAGLIGRIVWIAREACRRGELFGGYVALGVAVLFASQVFINVGVASGLLPTKGLTLPLISYGGSSLLVCLAMLGLVARLSHENRLAEAHRERLEAAGEFDDEP